MPVPRRTDFRRTTNCSLRDRTASVDMNEQSTDESDSNAPRAGVAPPRVWTVFAALGGALLLSIVFQAGLVAVVAIIEFHRGVKPEELGEVVMERLTSPYVFILLIGATCFAVCCWPAFWREQATAEQKTMAAQ